MIDLVSRLKVANKDTAQVMEHIDRKHFCVGPANPYIDSPQRSIGSQTISAPHIHAMALDILGPLWVDAADRSLLDVGCGTGYVAVAFASILNRKRLAGTVLAIDISPALCDAARVNVEKFSMRDKVTVLYKSLRQVYAEHLKFTFIYVGAAVEEHSESMRMLLWMVKVGGFILAPLGNNLCLIRKATPRKCFAKVVASVRFVSIVDA